MTFLRPNKSYGSGKIVNNHARQSSVPFSSRRIKLPNTIDKKIAGNGETAKQTQRGVTTLGII